MILKVGFKCSFLLKFVVILFDGRGNGGGVGWGFSCELGSYLYKRLEMTLHLECK